MNLCAKLPFKTGAERLPVSIRSAGVDDPGDWSRRAPRQWQVFSLVTFFGPAKKVTRLPAGTGECDLVSQKVKDMQLRS
jgi:hypothetical protein